MIKAQATIVLTVDHKGRLDIRTNGDDDLAPMVDALLNLIATLVKPSTIIHRCMPVDSTMFRIVNRRGPIYGDVQT